jgi:hypothetical protein
MSDNCTCRSLPMYPADICVVHGRPLDERVARRASKLKDAFASGRKAGLEEAAKVAEACCGQFPACGVAVTAIRSRLTQGTDRG